MQYIYSLCYNICRSEVKRMISNFFHEGKGTYTYARYNLQYSLIQYLRCDLSLKKPKILYSSLICSSKNICYKKILGAKIKKQLLLETTTNIIN